MLVSFWSALIARCIPLSKLLCGVRALLRASLTPILNCLALSESSCLAIDSVAAMMFTKVPVDDALQAIFTLLTQDETLDERTTIPVPDICALTELCLRSTYFMFEDTFFDQAEGAAMQTSKFMDIKALQFQLVDPRMVG